MQHRPGAEQPLDDGQRPGGVPVVQPFPHAGQVVRAAVCLVDRLEAGQGSAGQRDEQFLPPDLVRTVVQGRQYPVDQPDPVPLPPALHDSRLLGGVRGPGLPGGRMAGHQRPGDQRMQPVRMDRPAMQQLQIGRNPGRRIGQHRQARGGPVTVRGHLDPRDRRSGAVRAVVEVQQQPAPRPEAYEDGPAGPALGRQQHPRLVRPPAHGTAVPGRHDLRCPPARYDGAVRGRLVGAGPRPQLGGAAGVPQMPVQIEPVAAAGPGVRVAARVGRRAGSGGSVPQRETDPLSGVRPGGRGPHHEVHRVRARAPLGAVPGQRDRQPRPQQPVGGDPRQVPAQQVRSETPQVGP